MGESINGLGPIALALILGMLFSIAYASLYHLWIGRSGRDLMLFVLMSFVGFAIGHALGTLLQIDFFRIGQLHIVEGTVGALLAMIGAQRFYADR